MELWQLAAILVATWATISCVAALLIGHMLRHGDKVEAPRVLSIIGWREPEPGALFRAP